MTWVSLVLAAIKFASLFLDWARSQKDYDRGREAEISEALKSLNEKLGIKVQIDSEIMGKTDEQVDKDLKGLEP